MKDRGMIFNGEMVRAILDGRKTQTRRIVKPQPELTKGSGFSWKGAVYGSGSNDHETNRNFAHVKCPHGKPGDRLWVRETWARYNIDQNSHDMAYQATTPEDWPKEGRWRPSIHMPRQASRILLEITSVRVERLNDISSEDAESEGLERTNFTGFGDEPGLPSYPEPDVYYDPFKKRWEEYPPEAFAGLWKSIYGEESWQANPWVWVIEFKRIEGGEA
ncbi:ASCH domain-containing protein [Citrobacter freundii]|uniref:hypothetical protein n=1 Tax=Citrobacter freundii TaxID=546 RepID=UPI00397E31C0